MGMKDFQKQLQNVFNMSNYESRIYIASQGEPSTVSELSTRSGISRTAIYIPLKNLVSKGFISPVKTKGKRTLYQGIEPKYLKNLFSRREVDLDEIIEYFGKSISNLSGEVIVRYFEGINGAHLASDIFLQESDGKLWKTFENPVVIEKISGTKHFSKYIEARVNKKIHARVIIPGYEHSPWVKEIIENKNKYLLEPIIVSPNEYPLEASIGICAPWIIFIVAKEQKPFALLIKNEPLAITAESIHDMVWDRFNR